MLSNIINGKAIPVVALKNSSAWNDENGKLKKWMIK